MHDWPANEAAGRLSGRGRTACDRGAPARTYPLILELIEQSTLTLTAIRLLAPHLTAANHRAVLASAQHRSKCEVEALVVALQRKPDVPVIVRKLPVARCTTAAASSVPDSPGVPSTPCAAMVFEATAQLRCRAHNAYEARLFFGDGVARESRTAWGANSFRNEFDMNIMFPAGG